MRKLSDFFLFRKESEDTYLLFNYKSYQCYLLNEAGYRIIKELEASPIDSISEKLGANQNDVANFIESLIPLGVIKEDDKAILPSKAMGIESSFVKLKGPVRATWLITNRCNIRCKHCYIGADPKSNMYELPLNEVKRILGKLADADVFTMYFTGGEPFARRDFLDIIKEASDVGLKMGISTNGLLIDDDIIGKLVDFGVFRVQVSLDGSTAKTHEFIRGAQTFEKTVGAIKKLVAADIDVGITFVCHKGNVSELSDVLQLAAQLEVKGIKISPLMAWGRAKEELKEYIPTFDFRSILKDMVSLASEKTGVNLLNELHIDTGMPDENPYGCPLVIGMTLLPNGNVIPCEIFGENINQNPIIGDLKNQTVEEIWNSPGANRFRDAAKIDDKPCCNRCSFLQECGSYCLGEVFVKYGKLIPPKAYFTECKKMWKKASRTKPLG